MNEFIHLHLHDEFSYLDSAIRIEDLAALCKERDIPAVAQTNHGNIDGVLRFSKAMAGVGVKPLLGCELYVVTDSTKSDSVKRKHLTVLAKNEEGFANLCQLLTRANVEGFYRKPLVHIDWLLEHNAGLIVLSGCYAGLFYEFPNHFPRFAAAFGKDLYLEVMPLVNFGDAGGEMYWQRLANLKLLRKRFGTRLVATNDVHYLYEGDATLHEVVMAVGMNKKWDDPKRKKYNLQGFHLKTFDEMTQGLLQQGLWSDVEIAEALSSTERIAADVNFTLQKRELTMPLPPNAGDDEHATLRNLCLSVLTIKKLGAAYRERLEAELPHIIPQFTRYFLIVRDVVQWAKEQGIMVGPGRGSVGGSLVAFLLGITAIDPIKFGLLFERFITPGRVDLPDIDLDFQHTRRDEVIAYLRRTYGEKNVALVRTFTDLKGRNIVRDLGRIFKLPAVDVESMSSALTAFMAADEANTERCVQQSIEKTEAGQAFASKYPDIAGYAQRMEGLIRNKGKHPAGVVISAVDLQYTGNCVLEKLAEGVAVNWDKRDLQYNGFVKYDFLGLNTLSVLDSTIAMIQALRKKKVDVAKIPLTDEQVFGMLNNGEVFGVFQYQTPAMERYVRRFGLKTFMDMAHLTALDRPGCLASGLMEQYLRRRSGMEDVTYIHPRLKPLLSETLGVPVYQEQVMYMVHDLAGLPWEQVDAIRKVIGSSAGLTKMLSFKEDFIRGCSRTGSLDAESAAQVFDMIAHFGGYGFNKSHAVAYALLGYWTAWFKYYYPAEYFCSYLLHSRDADDDKLCCRELIKRGVPVLYPDINRSDVGWALTTTAEGKTAVVCGLASVKNIGSKTAESIVSERKANGEYKSVDDLVRRSGINKRSIRFLAMAGALSEFLTNEGLGALLSGAEKDTDGLFGEEKSKGGPYAITVQKKRDLMRESVSFWGFEDPLSAYDSLCVFLKRELAKENKVVPLSWFAEQARKVSLLPSVYSFGVLEAVRVNARGIYLIFADATSKYVHGLPHDHPYGKRLAENRDNVVEKECVFRIAMTGQSTALSGLWALSDVAAGHIRGLPITFYETRTVSSVPPCQCADKCANTGEYVDAWHSPNSIFMMLGEAPGANEAKEKMPFIGSAGKLLWAALGKKELTRDMFWVTNVVKCRPNDNKMTERLARTCFPHLDAEIRAFSPKVILSLGSWASQMLCGQKISAVANTVAWNNEYQCFVCYASHPAAVLHNATYREAFAQSIETFVAFTLSER